MLHLTLALALSMTSPSPAVTAAAVPPAPPPDPAATELANRFSAVVKCEPARKDPNRHLCALTTVGKEPIWTPGQASTYVGLSLKFKTGADVKKLVAEQPTLAALHLAAGSARIAPLTGASDAEKAKLVALANDLRGQLKGEKKDAVVIPPEFLGRLHGERSKARSQLKLDKMFAEFPNPAPTRLYRVDLAPALGVTTGPVSAFVTVETESDGQQLSIFPTPPIER